MKKLRIGIFTECYRPTLNGVVVSIDTFREDLEKRGHEFFIFTANTWGCERDDPRVFRYPSIPSTQKEFPLSLPWLAPLQTSRIRHLNLDLIHTQHLFMMGRLGLRIGRSLGIPVIHTYHTLITEYSHYARPFQKQAKKFVVNLSRAYCNLCDQVITPSCSMQKVLRSYGVTAPIEAIPTGVRSEDFQEPYHREILKTHWDIPEHQKILLYVSRIAQEKNLDFLFKTTRMLARKRKDWHLLMVGGGPLLTFYQAKIKKWDLESQVTFTGRQDKDKANRFFGAADIFVFPSKTETQGIVITEAMAAGVPAVAINIMGPSDLIQDGVDGFLTPLHLEAFLDKIEKLLDDEALRKTMGKNAQKSAEKFSAENSAIKMEKIYEKTIDNCA